MTWVHDGSYPGLLTAVFRVYQAKDGEAQIVGPPSAWNQDDPAQPELFGAGEVPPGLSGERRYVESDETLARRVLEGVRKNAGGEAVLNLRDLYLGEVADRDSLALAFVRRCLEWKKEVAQHVADPVVGRVLAVSRRVGGEAHRFQGLLRFQELADGAGYYAAFEPEVNVLPLVGDFFADRMGPSCWMIHDVRRRLAAVNRPGGLEMVAEVRLDRDLPLSEEEGAFQSLWKGFFRSIAVPGRENPKVQMGKMPKKYWKYLVEKS